MDSILNILNCIQYYNGAITAIATFFIALFTVFLFCLSKQQSKQTKILQRAYISAVPHGVTSFRSDRLAIGHVGFENVGHLPATDVRWFIKMEMSDDRNFVPSDGNDGDFSEPGNIPPGSEMKQDCRVKFSDPEIKSFLNSDTRFIYVWGKLTYHDGFADGRWTKFCHRYEQRGWIRKTPKDFPKYAAGPAILNEGMRYHERGNDAGPRQGRHSRWYLLALWRGRARD
ncbi:MAG: hypothetical protein H3C55_03200 [Pseudorhodoplanes sp.]|nr:hypothetical protein [Pseudorhodoplanes sp.]